MSDLISISLLNPEPAVLRPIAEMLTRGCLVGLPTDTLYGIAARIDCPDALSRLRVIKGLPVFSPLLFLVDSLEMAEKYWSSPLSGQLKKLMEAFWPGPLTIINKTKLAKPTAVHEGTLALRLPASAFLQELIELCGVPLASTSANAHGNPPASCPKEAMEMFPQEVGLWVDGGLLLRGEPSTIFDAVKGKIIRFGRVGAKEIWQVWQGINK